MSKDTGEPTFQRRSPDEHLESTVSLLDRARKGDRGAIDRLFARHAAPLKRWARGRLPRWARDLSDTDDLVQDTLLRTFKHVGDFVPGGDGALQAYLRQAVMNRLRDEIRRHGRLPEMVDVADLTLAGGSSPLKETIERESMESYERALQRLTPEEREAVVLRIQMGFSYAELAEALGKPTPDAARKAAQRAVVRLAREMKREQ
jgi:RNA polymerase sigma-70 factor (ECF subfamily)